MNKLGNYITQLMTTVIDKEQEQFVKDLALFPLIEMNILLEVNVQQLNFIFKKLL